MSRTLELPEPLFAALEEAAKENPASFVTQTALAVQLAQHGEGQRALAACEHAVRARPGYAQARFWLGILNLRRKRFGEHFTHA